VADEPKLSKKVENQLAKAKLPMSGTHPFSPSLTKNKKGETIVKRAEARSAPRAQAGRMGWVDSNGRIWLRDRAHAGLPDHWDVQEDDGRTYFRVGDDGNMLR